MIYLADGPDGEISLPAPVSVQLERDVDAPADGFDGEFPLFSECGRLTALKILSQDGAVRFDGIVDEQERSLSGGTLSISARSNAALLLDNEAIPQSYVNPSLATIFNRHIRPYGFTQYRGEGKTFSGTFTVTKGMSEWSAAAAFCSSFLKTVPRILNDVYDASGEVPDQELAFGTGGIRFSSGTLRNRYCELYSELYLLDSDGGTYQLSAQDAEAVALGVVRRRLLSSGTDVSSVLEQARQDAMEAVLDCPGNITAQLNAPARILGAPADWDDELCVSSVSYRIDAGGEHTKITLRRNSSCG